MHSAPEARIAPLLMPNESLLWAGQPRQGLLLRPADAYLIPFSLMWAGFACFWEYSVLTSDGPSFFAIWGIPFVLFGIYIVLGRFLVDAWARSRTTYALTTQRILILAQRSRGDIKSLRLGGLTNISLAERSDGSGTITFGDTAPWWAGTAGWPGAGRFQAPMFESITGVRGVFDRILSAQTQVNSPRV